MADHRDGGPLPASHPPTLRSRPARPLAAQLAGPALGRSHDLRGCCCVGCRDEQGVREVRDGHRWGQLAGRPRAVTGAMVAVTSADPVTLWGVPPNDYPMRPARRWTTLLDAAPDGRLAVGDDRIYAASTLTDPRTYALSLSTGELLWERPSEYSIQGGMALADDLVVYGDDGGTLYGVARATGEERWTHESDSAGAFLDPDSRGSLPEGAGLQLMAMFSEAGQFVGTPRIVDGTVLAGTFDGDLYAVDAATGDRQWGVELSGGFSIGVRPAVCGDTVVAASTEGAVVGLDRRTGDHVWEATIDGGVYGSPVVLDGTVVLTPARETPVYGFDVATGTKRRVGDPEPVAESRLGDPVPTHISVDPTETVLYLLGSQEVTALEPDGTVAWQRAVECRPGVQPVVVEDLLVVGGDTDAPQVLGLEAATGEPVFELPVDNYVSALEHCSAGLLVGDGDQSLHLYESPG